MVESSKAEGGSTLKKTKREAALNAETELEGGA